MNLTDETGTRRFVSYRSDETGTRRIYIRQTAITRWERHLFADAVTKSLHCQVYLTKTTITQLEVDALGVITISRGCFERCGSNKKTPP